MHFSLFTNMPLSLINSILMHIGPFVTKLGFTNAPFTYWWDMYASLEYCVLQRTSCCSYHNQRVVRSHPHLQGLHPSWLRPQPNWDTHQSSHILLPHLRARLMLLWSQVVVGSSTTGSARLWHFTALRLISMTVHRYIKPTYIRLFFFNPIDLDLDMWDKSRKHVNIYFCTWQIEKVP